MRRPIILIHGYSDSGPSFKRWKDILEENGFDPTMINVCDYKTLTNEVTIKDLAEGFDRALRLKSLHNKEFDAIVHSTGMLVLRSWLSTYHEKRLSCLKHLIGLAPASFGSPLAYKGRSWMGALFKGNRSIGPDFLDAGDKVLDGLELGSYFTWNLAHKDLLDEHTTFYSPGPETPYVFILVGNENYGGLINLVAKAPGTDGTVRHAGCSLNTRKITIDFTREPENRYNITEWKQDERSHLAIPFIPVEGLNHATILSDPTAELIKSVIDALNVSDGKSLNEWNDKAVQRAANTYRRLHKYQQFIVHCKDERGDGIPDFHIQLFYKSSATSQEKLADMDMHMYSTDNSYRCFHVDLNEIDYENLFSLRLELTASSGSELIGYCDYQDPTSQAAESTSTILLDLTKYIADSNVKFFYPFTTTLIELTLNREPWPYNQENKLVKFIVLS
jgi:hypothetical protein